MKIAPRNKKMISIAAIALLLVISMPLAAIAQGPPPVPDDTVPPPPPPQQPQPQPPPPPQQPVVENPPPVVENPPPVVENPPPVVENPPPVDNNPQPHPSAPFSPPADCIVAHAATPAQLCPMAGGLQYYFIGADGSSQTGPWIQPFSELATLHSGGASLYSGTNPFTGKSVQIHYLPADQKIRISTFYPDTEYDTNKPYNFTVDSGNTVTHEAW